MTPTSEQSTSAVTPDAQPATPAPRSRLRKELIMAAVCLGTGLIVLPIGIYVVGTGLLGDYGGGPHIGSFFGDFFRNLLSGVARTWFIVLSPYLAVMLLRLIFWRWRGSGDSARTADLKPKDAHAPHTKERREPFVAP